MGRRRGRSPKGGGGGGGGSGGGQASVVSSIVNLLNTIVGAGTLAMPAALSHMGVALGTGVILWSAATAAFGLYLQGRCARYLDRGAASFFALSQITYPNAAVVFDTAIAVKCFGVGVSYLIIIGDLMPGVVAGFLGAGGGGGGSSSSRTTMAALLSAYPPFLFDRHFWITAFMLLIVPLAFLRRLDSLKYTSVVALVSISYLVVLVVYHYAAADVTGPGHPRGAIHYVAWDGPVALLRSLPVVVFAYTCHQNMFSILNELQDDSPAGTVAVVGTSIGSAAAIYVLVAITGYLTFGSNVVGNIVSMYPPNLASTIGKAAIVVLVTFSVPLQVHPCRASLDAVLRWRPNRSATATLPAPSSSGIGGGGSSSSNTGGSSSQALLPTRTPPPGPVETDSHGAPVAAPLSDMRFALLTTAILVGSYATALGVASLDRVLAYVGSTGSTSISFILPGLFFYKISDPDSRHQQRLAKADDDAAVPGAPQRGRRLLDSDDGDTDSETEIDPREVSLLAGAAVPRTGATASASAHASLDALHRQLEQQRRRRQRLRQRRRRWRWDLEHLEHGLLRTLALVLAGYGGCVMVVCLGMNVFGGGGGH